MIEQRLLAALCAAAVVTCVAGVYKYNTTAGPQAGRINLHFLCHSHDDVGWIKTPTQYLYGMNPVELTPSLIDPYGQQTSRLNPTARVTIGKRISDRAYLTFSRSLGTIQSDQVVLLEYEASDRLSWVLSRNEDNQTFTLEFRVRHIF